MSTQGTLELVRELKLRIEDKKERSKLCDLTDELEAETRAWQTLFLRVSRILDTLPDTACAILLSKRYLLGKPWDHIADEMHYSLRHIHRLHTKALRLCEEALSRARDDLECHQ